VNRHQFLKGLHATYRPRNYLEIGVNDGRSLTLSRVPSIAIDPAFKITSTISCDVRLVKATSDAFFARKDPLGHLRSGRNPFRALARRNPRSYFGDARIELSFIDGMHLFEFALRDFNNIESHAFWSSVIVFDDMLPRNVDEAARDRHTDAWTGDVYKVIEVLNRYRSDLVLVPVDTAPTGLLVILGADPTNTVLKDKYDEILKEYVVPDPQEIPAAVLERRNAVDPETFLAADFWRDLVRARNLGRGSSSFKRLKPRIEAAVRDSIASARVHTGS
jgi:hypothetical protein